MIENRGGWKPVGKSEKQRGGSWLHKNFFKERKGGDALFPRTKEKTRVLLEKKGATKLGMGARKNEATRAGRGDATKAPFERCELERGSGFGVKKTKYRTKRV